MIEVKSYEAMYLFQQGYVNVIFFLKLHKYMIERILYKFIATYIS